MGGTSSAKGFVALSSGGKNIPSPEIHTRDFDRTRLLRPLFDEDILPCFALVRRVAPRGAVFRAHGVAPSGAFGLVRTRTRRKGTLRILFVCPVLHCGIREANLRICERRSANSIGISPRRSPVPRQRDAHNGALSSTCRAASVANSTRATPRSAQISIHLGPKRRPGQLQVEADSALTRRPRSRCGVPRFQQCPLRRGKRAVRPSHLPPRRAKSAAGSCRRRLSSHCRQLRG